MDICGNKKCDRYRVEKSYKNNCTSYFNAGGCPDYEPLKADKEPVAEVPCNARVISPATELLKDVATEFFYWWHNQPGTNTADGFDDWWEMNHSRFGL